jgi:hypothetical protein
MSEVALLVVRPADDNQRAAADSSASMDATGDDAPAVVLDDTGSNRESAGRRGDLDAPLALELSTQTPRIDSDASCTDDERPIAIRQTRRRWKRHADRDRLVALKNATVEAERAILTSLHIHPSLMRADLGYPDDPSSLSDDDGVDTDNCTNNDGSGNGVGRATTGDTDFRAADADGDESDEVEIVAVRPVAEVLNLSTRPRPPQPASQRRVAALIRFRSKHGRMPPLPDIDPPPFDVNGGPSPDVQFAPPKPSMFAPSRLAAIKRFRRKHSSRHRKVLPHNPPYLSVGIWLLDKNRIICPCHTCSPARAADFPLGNADGRWAAVDVGDGGNVGDNV